MTHTPGPWRVPKRFDIYQELGPNAVGTYIGTTAGNRVLPESVAIVDEANARLMAAAPELLDIAINGACNFQEGANRCGACERCAATARAIAKATGKG